MIYTAESFGERSLVLVAEKYFLILVRFYNRMIILPFIKTGRYTLIT